MGNRLSRRVNTLEQDIKDLKDRIAKLEEKLGSSLAQEECTQNDAPASSRRTGARGSRSKRNSFNVEKYQQEIQRTLQRAGEEE
jgi:cellulose biosynthesis protein BcsQ